MLDYILFNVHNAFNKFIDFLKSCLYINKNYLIHFISYYKKLNAGKIKIINRISYTMRRRGPKGRKVIFI